MARIILNETSYFGAGCRSELVGELTRRGLLRALVVTDKDLMKFGVTKKVTQELDGANIAYKVFDDVKANPTIKNCKDGIAAYKAFGADHIVAVGGGSVIDTAKAVGIVISNPAYGDIRSLSGAVDTKNKSVPVIAFPTTAGTAAEVTINYVITDEDNKRKMVCVDPHDIPVVAIIDSDLTESMPKGLTAATGMDALTHAIEAYITPGAWAMSDMFELNAIGLIAKNLPAAVKNGKDKTARQNMALAQYVAGMGFSNVGLGIVHSMAHPLGAVYDIPHGVANAMILPTVMKYNIDSPSKHKYRAIAEAMGVCTDGLDEDAAAQSAVDAVVALAREVGIPERLRDVGVKAEDLELLSTEAFNDVCTGGNPRKTCPAEIKALYRSIY